MVRHWSSLIALFVLLTTSLQGKDKKTVLPAYVLQARTVLVVIDRDAGVSPANPNENGIGSRRCRKSSDELGRFTPVMDAQTADLVISVRRGHGKAVLGLHAEVLHAQHTAVLKRRIKMRKLRIPAVAILGLAFACTSRA